jgi:hypothetical protein
MYYSYIEIEYAAMSFSPARTDLALKLLNSYPPHLAQILGFWVTYYIMVEDDSHLKLLHASNLVDIAKCLSTFICCP